MNFVIRTSILCVSYSHPVSYHAQALCEVVMPLRRSFVMVIAWSILFLALQRNGFGQERMLRDAIDLSIESRSLHPSLVAGEISPSLQLRRLSLDLRNTVPTQQEVEEFLADASPDRWQKWVKRFLDDPLHRERLVDWLDKTLIQRRPNQLVDRESWLSYLRSTVDQAKPIDVFLKEMITSVWWNTSERASQRFFLERGGDPHAITRDIGRIFFGRDVQCAQCHDHPQIDDYLQIDYHGILAFVSASSSVEAKFKDEKGTEQKIQLYVEKAPSDGAFESVFDKGIFFRSGPRTIGGTELFESYLTPDARYSNAPLDRALEGVGFAPVISRRATFAIQLSENPAFAENWANRLWALMMGRGLVHPLDMHHAENPPSNPELLELLRKALVENQFQIRPLIEEIANSKAYRRDSQFAFANALTNGSVLSLPPDQMAALLIQLRSKKESLEVLSNTGTDVVRASEKSMEDSESLWRKSQSVRVSIRADLEKGETTFNDLKKKADDAIASWTKATKSLEDERLKISALDDAVTKLEYAKSLSVGDNSELQQAIQIAKTKSDQSKSDLPKSEKIVSDAAIAKDNAVDSLNAQRQSILEIASKLELAEKELAILDKQFLEKRIAWQTVTKSQLGYARSMAELEKLISWIELSNHIRELEQRSTDIQSLAVAEKTRIDAYAIEIDRLKTSQESLSQSKVNIESSIAKLDTQSQEHRGKIQQLALALSALEQSESLVSDSTSFSAAKESIKGAIDQRNGELESIQNAIKPDREKLAAIEQSIIESKEEESQWQQKRAQSVEVQKNHEASIRATGDEITNSIENCAQQLSQIYSFCESENYMSVQRALSPEQLGWSILQSTQVLGNFVRAEMAELSKTPPPEPEKNEAWTLQLPGLSVRKAIDKLRGNVDTFSNLYSSGVGQTMDEFFATPDQALFMSNGGAVYQWSYPNGNNVGGLMAQTSDPQNAATILYMTLFSRPPSESQRAWVVEKMDSSPEKKNGVIQELVWAALTSIEFRLYP